MGRRVSGRPGGGSGCPALRIAPGGNVHGSSLYHATTHDRAAADGGAAAIRRCRSHGHASTVVRTTTPRRSSDGAVCTETLRSPATDNFPDATPSCRSFHAGSCGRPADRRGGLPNTGSSNTVCPNTGSPNIRCSSSGASAGGTNRSNIPPADDNSGARSVNTSCDARHRYVSRNNRSVAV